MAMPVFLYVKMTQFFQLKLSVFTAWCDRSVVFDVVLTTLFRLSVQKNITEHMNTISAFSFLDKSFSL